MKIIYQYGKNWTQTPSLIPSEPDAIVLSHNNWDDHGYKTTLNAALFLNSSKILDFTLKVLTLKSNYTADFLDTLIKSGWNGHFPIPDTDYISIPSDISFYSMLSDILSNEEAKQTLLITKDAGYLTNVLSDSNALSLTQTDAWNTSMMREAGASKSFADGWKVLESNEEPQIQDFTLNILKRNKLTQPINFKFNSKILPYDINILIGPNGIGKSHCLKSLVEYWLGVESGNKELLSSLNHTPFINHPNISRLLLISYSPFEEFTLDLESTRLQDKSAYKYFGFRQNIERDGQTRIGINRNLPASDSVNSLLKAFDEDFEYDFMPSWIGKAKVIQDILRNAFGVNHLALSIKDDFIFDPFFTPNNVINIENQRFLLIDKNINSLLAFTKKEDIFDYEKGVFFIKNDKKYELSSGQRLFCYIVINVVGNIKKDTLVVIDEPELFLHPTLEIEFISLLKQVNKAFNSKTILATHSLTIARETPSRCVHVFRDLEDGLDVVHPPFETFGGDMQRISTYVFSDNSVPRPFDDWIEAKLLETDPGTLIKELGNEINEELIIKILNSESSDGR